MVAGMEQCTSSKTRLNVHKLPGTFIRSRSKSETCKWGRKGVAEHLYPVCLALKLSIPIH